jgi:hypothetical protein
MTSHPLWNVFEAMMEKGQDQIPDDGFLMTKMPRYFIVAIYLRIGRRFEDWTSIRDWTLI